MDIPAAVAAATSHFGLVAVHPLTTGGQKTVCTASWAGADVVLKIVLLSTSADPNVLERCQREVAVLQTTSSAHLVQILTPMELLGPGPDAAVWLEEYLDGTDMRSMTGGTWTWAEAAQFLVDVGSGLTAMHTQNYIHRDLSHGNVRRLSSGSWKVMDPGLAKHLNRTSITGLFQPGTPGFLSPEHVLTGARITTSSDVFCLGNLAYLGLTGSLAVAYSGDLNEYVQRLSRMSAVNVAVARPDIPAQGAAIINRCLLRQPARRFLDAEEVVTAVQSMAGGSP
jgi:serine/threonine protein kinase